MPFELQQVTEVAFTNSNPRSEFHGEEHVRAIDIAMTIAGENTLLDLIEPGLREHEYTNRDLKAGQQPLPDVVIPLPHRRFPHLPEKVAYAKGDKWRGYRFVVDYGLGGDSNVDLTDCVVTGLWYETQEGGSVTIGFTVQYNGGELQDDRLYGRLAGLATAADGHVQLLAPATVLPVKKGWRSGVADTPVATDGGAPLLEGAEGGEGSDTPAPDGEQQDPGEDGFAEGSPEEALLDSVQPQEADPFDTNQSKGRRGRKESAETGHVRAAAAA